MSGAFSIRRQMTVISGLVCVLAIISFLLFYYGRQHKVIIDNRSAETADGQSFRPLAGALVAVNHKTLDRDEVSETAVPAAQRPFLSFKFWPSPDFSTAKAAEMMPRERILVKVLGPDFNLKSEAFNQTGESMGVKEIDVHLGMRRDAMIRLVKLYHGLPGYLEEFPNDALGRRPPAEEETKAPAEGEPLPDSPAAPSLGE